MVVGELRSQYSSLRVELYSRVECKRDRKYGIHLGGLVMNDVVFDSSALVHNTLSVRGLLR